MSNYFVTVFDANGKLRYSTYLGGSEDDGSGFTDDNSNGNNVAVDAHGLVYITGTTDSGGSNSGIKFPVTPNALQPDMKGATDSFVCIFDPAKSGADSRIYCSFLGGDGNEKGHSIAVNAAGDLITAAGYTDSDDFPTTPNAYRSHYAPGFTSNGFVAQFRSSKPGDPSSEYTARYSTYLGADSSKARDDIYGMVMDANGLILATGRTQSADFPMTGPGTPFLFNSAPYLGHGESERSALFGKDRSILGWQGISGLFHLSGRRIQGLWFVLHQCGRRFARQGVCWRGNECSGCTVHSLSCSSQCYRFFRQPTFRIPPMR